MVRRSHESSTALAQKRAGINIAQAHANVRKKALAMLCPSRIWKTTVPARLSTTASAAALSNRPQVSATWPRKAVAVGVMPDGEELFGSGELTAARPGNVTVRCGGVVGACTTPALATSRAISVIVRY